jgi:hypothetical protein
MVDVVFFTGGLAFAFNPFGLAEKYIRFTSRMGGPRIDASERFMSRIIGAVMIVAGSGILAARTLSSLGVSDKSLTALLPIGIAALLATIAIALFAIHRETARGNRQSPETSERKGN